MPTRIAAATLLVLASCAGQTVVGPTNGGGEPMGGGAADGQESDARASEGTTEPGGHDAATAPPDAARAADLRPALDSTASADAVAAGADTSAASDGAPRPAERPPATPLAGLLWLVDGETGGLQAEDQPHDGAALHFCKGHPETVTVSDRYPTYAGRYSVRVLLGRDWGWGAACAGVGGGFAARPFIEADKEYWHGWAAFIPADSPRADTWLTAMWRAAEQPNKVLSLRMNVPLNWSFIGSAEFGDLTLPTVSFGRAAPGQWQEFVANLIISKDAAKGRIRIWHRVRGEPAWKPVVDVKGRTAGLTAQFPYWVEHLMHSGHSWNDTASATREIYFDEIRVGDASTGMDAVAPGSGTRPSTP